MNNLPPKNIISALKNNAPHITISENYGRRSEYFGDEDIESQGYKAIILFIQIGLSDYFDLILEVIRLIFIIQKDCGKKYPIIPAFFG